MNVKDKVVIITGGGGGIGLAAARAFAHGQAHVLITGRRGQALEEIASREQRIKAFVADVGNPADTPRTIAKAVELWGRIDVLVNNAGAGVSMALANASVEHVQAIYAVNTIGPTLLAAAAVPHLEKSRGAIINISSSLGTKAVAGFADYAASKAALEHLTRCWAVELAPKGVRVNAIASGPVESTFLRDRMGYSDPVAMPIGLPVKCWASMAGSHWRDALPEHRSPRAAHLQQAFDRRSGNRWRAGSQDLPNPKRHREHEDRRDGKYRHDAVVGCSGVSAQVAREG